jgi:hypothetical protein
MVVVALWFRGSRATPVRARPRDRSTAGLRARAAATGGLPDGGRRRDVPGKAALDWELGMAEPARPAGWIATVVVVALLALLMLSADAIALQRESPLAVRLAARDPGARIHANTMVARGAGAVVHGSHVRRNFVAALGPRQTIVGGKRGDHLAALGDHVTIIGNSGHDVVYGSRGARLVGGSGRDLLVARGADATIRTGTGDVAVVERQGRVLCSRSARNVTIYVRKGVSVRSRCRAGQARVLRLSRLRQGVPPVATQSVVQGDGSNDHPFVAPCDQFDGNDCTVNAFPARTLSGAWANEYVPAYECPTSHPYLRNKKYSAAFTSWGPGVEIVEDSTWAGNPIGVSITGNSYFEERTAPNLFSGTLTGFPNSSATNWLWGGTHSYTVILHCTSDRCRGTDNVGAPPGCSAAITGRARQASAPAPKS